LTGKCGYSPGTQPLHPLQPPQCYTALAQAREGRHPGDRIYAQCAARRDGEYAPNSTTHGETGSFDGRRRNPDQRSL